MVRGQDDESLAKLAEVLRAQSYDVAEAVNALDDEVLGFEAPLLNEEGICKLRFMVRLEAPQAKLPPLVVLAKHQAQVREFKEKDPRASGRRVVDAQSASHIRGFNLRPEDIVVLDNFWSRADAHDVWEAARFCVRLPSSDPNTAAETATIRKVAAAARGAADKIAAGRPQSESANALRAFAEMLERVAS